VFAGPECRPMGARLSKNKPPPNLFSTLRTYAEILSKVADGRKATVERRRKENFYRS